MAHYMGDSSRTVSNSSISHKSCNASRCLCPFHDKRNYQMESGSWEIVLCKTCSLYGTHRICSFIQSFEDWSCKTCNIAAGVFEESSVSVSLDMSTHDMDIISKIVQLLERNGCSVEKCICPFKGREKYEEEIGHWEIIMCNTCGVNGAHRICGFVKCFQPWYCRACKDKAPATTEEVSNF